MFFGEYQHTLDAKGRVSLPARFRNQLGGAVTVAKGLDHALYVFLPEDYEQFMGDLLAKSDFNPKVREVRRFFASGALEIQLDSAGRVSLSQQLREWASLDKDVVVIGSGDRIELWDSARWDEYNGRTADNVEALAQELAEAGLL
ncbi:MAG: division/cell wall cluster transcriptional repressor MraZ [Coriobacteriia bacterium]|nr:division/cell wall cluster transcriptional repressor MraZ [Coriobacteriia bacterium]